MKKKYKNKSSIFLVSWVLLFTILFTGSCAKEPVKPDNSDIKDKAEYDLKINGKNLIGIDVESNWDSDLGIIWLGTDENNLPTGTLTAFIDTFHSDVNTAIISSAILSHVDQLVGTSEEINAKTYSTLGDDNIIFTLSDVEVGSNYISGRLTSLSTDANLGGWLMEDLNTGEIHTLSGTFTAIVEQP